MESRDGRGPVITMTDVPPGDRAAQIADWAWDNPPARARQALDQVNEIARGVLGPADLRKVQDAGLMLTRLAGTLTQGGPG